VLLSHQQIDPIKLTDEETLNLREYLSVIEEIHREPEKAEAVHKTANLES